MPITLDDVRAAQAELVAAIAARKGCKRTEETKLNEAKRQATLRLALLKHRYAGREVLVLETDGQIESILTRPTAAVVAGQPELAASQQGYFEARLAAMEPGWSHYNAPA